MIEKLSTITDSLSFPMATKALSPKPLPSEPLTRPPLVDSHGRRIRKLRVSLLDACNFRCFYCMPLQPTFMPSSRWLGADEIENICRILTSFGLEQIRLTGGEPTLRGDFRNIVERLSKLPVKKLSVTTNGFRIQKDLHFLKGTKCNSINFSLDSLNRNMFYKITKKDMFDWVYQAILEAKDQGFQVKINTVLMRGINDHEISDFIEFSSRHDIEVRFLELMKIGEACGPQKDLFVSADEALKTIRKTENLIVQNTDYDSTSFNFTTASGAKVGFIASESKPFCGNCSRWRLSADGFLRACLMSEKGVKIRNTKPEDYEPKLFELLEMKPFTRIEKVSQNMNAIGG